MKPAEEDKAYCSVDMTPGKRVQYDICLSEAEIEPTSWSIVDTDRVVN
jgi:hypothetical protein